MSLSLIRLGPAVNCGNTQHLFSYRLKTCSLLLPPPTLHQILLAKAGHIVSPNICRAGKYVPPMEEVVVSRERIFAEQ